VCANAAILSDIKLESGDQQTVITIQFNTPVRYVRHNPGDFGKEVRIQVRPVSASLENSLELRTRETLVPPDKNEAGITQVEYDGRIGVSPIVTVLFNRARLYEIQQGGDFRSLQVILPLDEPGTAEKSTYSATASDKQPVSGQESRDAGFLSPSGLPPLSDARQKSLIEEGAVALQEEDYARAVQVFTRLLDSADPDVRQSAQFKLAHAQEQQGHLAHARAEYDRYLQSYPNGEYFEQAKDRLDRLLTSRRTSIDGDGISLWQSEFFGSIAQYYERDVGYPDYEGYEGDDSIVNFSTLLTTLDATFRLDTDSVAAEAVVVGSYEDELEEGQDDRLRGNLIYLDVEDYRDVFAGRLGRQRVDAGGVFGRFDGLLLGYRFADRFKLNFIGGFPVERSYDDVNTDRYFYGLSTDLGPFWENWGANVYFIHQRADGIDDRRALGAEMRYTSNRASLFSQFDYDILFDEPTLFLISGNWLLPNDLTRAYFSADFRTSPILSTYNGSIGQLTPSLDTLVDLLGEDEVRQLALDRTLDSSYATVGLSHSITDDVQISADAAWSRLSGAPASGGIEAFESTGDEYYYSVQMNGSNLLIDGDLSTLALRYADTKQRDTYSLLLYSSYPYPLLRDLRFGPKLRIDYRSNKEDPGDQWQIRPILDLEYVFADRWRVEFEGEYRWANRELEGLAEDKEGYYLSIGLRYDF